jgi:hypothetical protein
MDAIEKALGLLNDLSDWIDDEREQADAMVGKVGQSDATRSRSYALKDVGRKVDAIKTQIAKMIMTPPPAAGIGSGTTTPEDNMQRRLTESEEQKLRVTWNYLGQIKSPWKEIQKIRQSVCDMLGHNTTDGLPYVDPPLTDEDARQRPWVMVRDDESDGWHGPRILAAVTPQATIRCYYILSSDGKTITTWTQCRRATPAEIAAAGLEVAE